MRMIRLIRLRRAGQAMIRAWYDNDNKGYTLERGDYDKLLPIAAALMMKHGLSRAEFSDEWTRKD